MNEHESVTPMEMAAHALSTDRGRATTLILSAAGASLAASVWLFTTGHQEVGIFIGLWVPSILSFGNMILRGLENE